MFPIIITILAILPILSGYNAKKNIEIGETTAAISCIALTGLLILLWLAAVIFAPEISAIFDNMIIDIS